MNNTKIKNHLFCNVDFLNLMKQYSRKSVQLIVNCLQFMTVVLFAR